MIAPRARWWAAGLGGLALFGCDAPASPEPVVREDAAPALEILFGGCAEVWAGPRCELRPEGALYVLVPDAEGGRVEVRVDGLLVEPARADRAGAARIRIERPAGARSVVVAHEGRRASIAIEEPLDAGGDALERARALRSRGALADARALLAPLLEADDARTRVRARSLAARVALSAGDLEGALEGLAQASRDASSAGMLQTAAIDATIRAELLRSRAHRLADADAALRASVPPPAAGALSRALARYHGALVARDRGDRRSALRDLREAARLAWAAGEEGLAGDAELVMLPILVELGRLDEARAALASRLASAPPTGCDAADLREHEAWIELAAGDPARARDALLEADRLLAESCTRPGSRANVAVDLARVALASDDLEAARRWLDRASAADDAPALARAFALEVEARLAMRDGDASRALRAWDELEARARAADAPALRYLAALGRGRALSARARHDDAADALEEAERILDAEARGVPLDEGREAFLTRRSESAELLVASRIAAGRLREAMDAARRARRRALVALSTRARAARLPEDERRALEEALSEHRRAREESAALAASTWSMPLAELAAHQARVGSAAARSRAALDRALARGGALPDASLAPGGEGTLALVTARVPGAWVALADEGGEVIAVRVEDAEALSPRDVLQRIVDALAAPLLRARELRWMPTGALAQVDLGEVALEGEPLPLRVPVSLGLDVPPRDGPGRAPSAGSAFLVVADPTGDLERAAREGVRVAGTLRAHGVPVVALRGTEAGLRAVSGALVGARFAWWAGHGEARGRDGLESALPLAGGEALEASDVLAMPRVPEDVVLLGCETARSGDASVAGLGLAQAFVVAGSARVLATARAVDDVDAERIAEALLQELEAGDERAIDAVSVARASRRLRDEGVSAWAALRLLVR